MNFLKKLMVILGEGSYGRVVAVDNFFVYKEQTTSDLSALLREVAALSLLHRSKVPGIVPFHGMVGKALKLTKFEGDICNLVMNALTVKMLLYQLLTTLSHMDSLCLVHCDIKPENILYRIVDGCYEFVLCDFGLSHFYDHRTLKVTRAIQTGMYRCPEIEVDGRYVDPQKIDIWSLGITISMFGLCEDNDELFSIVEQMTIVNPDDRPTASDLLQSPMFDYFRLKYSDSINSKRSIPVNCPKYRDFSTYVENMEFTSQMTRKMAIALFNEFLLKGKNQSKLIQQNIINIATLIFENTVFFNINEHVILNIMKEFNCDIYIACA